ncbi:hypothetical protein [Desulfobulbus alkaliphilus]|uniref:hypothetical protein n=1 Tax=Desulfobulbus alkaliphilus TaxID=869814 RepID=UPI00196560DD|nr:hypothetical protein [Desulfobulbus alkaliphilus]MBM9537531.1 hypothetical protein [Desulfobulbus alkaliphilus]
MKLSEQEAKLYFESMWTLQFFVNQKLRIYDINTFDEYADTGADVKEKIRDALFENPNLIDSFVQENPQNFPETTLRIISEWKNFIRGNFFIERLLKKYAIFIQEEKVYAVVGLSQSFDELIHHSTLPLYVDTVLLPFQGKIIYDGLLGFRNIYFGGGIKRSLKETYMRAKQNNRIIDDLGTLHDKNQKPVKLNSLKDWTPELNELANKAKNLKGSAEHPAIYSPAFSLVKASIEFAQLAVSGSNDSENLHKTLKKVSRAFNKTHSTLYREEY